MGRITIEGTCEKYSTKALNKWVTDKCRELELTLSFRTEEGSFADSFVGVVVGDDNAILAFFSDWNALIGKSVEFDAELPEDDDDWSDDDGLSDVEADSMTLASAGWGTDEDYGYYGDEY